MPFQTLITADVEALGLPGYLRGGGEKTVLENTAVLLLVVITVGLSLHWLSDEELKHGMGKTWFLARQIIPLLLIGILFPGIIVEIFPGIPVVTWFVEM